MTASVMKKNLQQLLPDLDLQEAKDVVVSQITLDSRKLNSGALFIAIKGQKVDGRDFISKSIEKGAAAILVEADAEWQNIKWEKNVPIVAVECLPEKISEIAGRFYDHVSHKMSLVAVTGTNGKTTCSLLVAQLLTAVQKQPAGVMGTLGFGSVNLELDIAPAQQIQTLTSTGLTTPDPISLQSILYEFRSAGVQSVAMEVSSHSLHQKRVAALQFHTAIFTNLTQDHLDYHGDILTYGRVKAELLQFPQLRYAIVNDDDEWASSLTKQAPASVTVIRYSVQKKSDVYVQNVQLNAQGVTAELITPWGRSKIRSPFLGLFNLSNLLAVIAAVCVQGYRLELLVPHLSRLVAAPGRMQSVVLNCQQDIQVIVDYAHTPDALETTLKAIRQHDHQRIWTVFGCGGDRDKTKRPIMGRIAETFSDCVLVTNDNPRSEDPAFIATDILRGMKNPHAALVIPDRAQAIDMAIQQANSGDLVLIAGKGHENYQVFAQITLPFSDEQKARIALESRNNKKTSLQLKGAQL